MSENTVRAQNEVAAAFAVTQNKIFYRANKQIYAIVGRNPDLQLVTTVWFDKFDTQQEFRVVLEYVMSLFREGSYRLVFADLRFQATGYDESAAWVRDEFVPALFAAGMEREAVVLPHTPRLPGNRDVAQLTTKLVNENGDARIRAFTDIALAKKWLLAGSSPDE